MSKFCQNCGTQLEDKDTFCTNCGTPTATNNQPTTPNQQVVPNQGINQPDIPNGTDVPYGQNVSATPTPNKKKRNIIIASVSVALVAVIAIVSCVFIFGGNSPSNLVDGYMKCEFQSGTADDMLELVPKELVNAKLVDEDKTLDEVKADLNADLIDDQADLHSSYSDFKWKILSEKEMSSDDLSDINDYCSEYGFAATEGKELNTYVTGKDISTGDEESDTMTFEIIKVDGDWYIHKVGGSKLISKIF